MNVFDFWIWCTIFFLAVTMSLAFFALLNLAVDSWWHTDKVDNVLQTIAKVSLMVACGCIAMTMYVGSHT